jgi:hypothetical protein
MSQHGLHFMVTTWVTPFVVFTLASLSVLKVLDLGLTVLLDALPASVGKTNAFHGPSPIRSKLTHLPLNAWLRKKR